MMTRLLLRLIAWTAPPADREWIVGDTLEELDHLEAAHGAAEGRRWLRREVWRALRHAAGHRLATRPRWTRGTVAGVRQELRLRVFRSSPAIAAAVVASVALGVGANSAVYSLFDQFLWRPLPVPEPHRLVNLRSPGQRWGSISSDQTGGVDSVFSYPLFRDIQRDAHLLTGVAGHRSSFANLGPPGDAVPAEILFVSGNYFPVLGLEPAHGRLLGDRDDRAAGTSCWDRWDAWRSPEDGWGRPQPWRPAVSSSRCCSSCVPATRSPCSARPRCSAAWPWWRGCRRRTAPAAWIALRAD